MLVILTLCVVSVASVSSSNDKNVFGNSLEICCTDPVTGFYRNGYCSTGPSDHGKHVVCATVTDRFLQFSKSVGNDLSTPNPDYNFPGLIAGNCWCLCALRWKEAMENGCAPPLNLSATHQRMLEFVPLDRLMQYNNVTHTQANQYTNSYGSGSGSGNNHILDE
ncbi:uncharacterized protein LOC100210334 [Hydra vulgaris]|uniref:Uncharacterized protein LOC100210334 n=1 Tax=Hydra vulgaris TaxID=6087 RepID=A0ABM4CTT8_HYDVU